MMVTLIIHKGRRVMNNKPELDGSMYVIIYAFIALIVYSVVLGVWW